MKLDDRPLSACVDPLDLAGGHQAECRCPEVEAEYAHQFLLDADPGTNDEDSAGSDGGRDR
jgi:hypothetical protein